MPTRPESEQSIPRFPGFQGVKAATPPSRSHPAGELERARAMVDLSSDLLFMLDADTGEIIDANATACRCLGQKRELLLGRNFMALLDESTQNELKNRLGRCHLPQRDDEPLISPLTLEGRTAITAEIALGCACGKDGDRRVAVASIRDVGHRVANETALRCSEERYRQLVEQSVDGIFVADDQGHYTDVNRSGCEMLGYSREELLGLSMADVVMADEVARIGPELACLAKGEIVRSEWRFRRKDNSDFHGEVVGRQLPDKRLQCILRDISERRAVEARLRQTEAEHRIALDAAELGIWSHDLRTDTIYHDERARSFCGIDQEYVPAATLFHRIHPEDALRLGKAMAAAMDPTQAPGDVASELRMRDADGGFRWLRVHAHVQFEGEGEGRKPVSAIGTLEDITQPKQDEERLQRLRNAYQALSEINRGIARASSEPELLATACRIAVERTGFRLVRIIPLETDFDVLGGSMHFGPATDLVARQQAEYRLAGTDEAQIWRMLLASGNKYCSTDPDADPLLSAWAPACAEFAIGALAVLPLRVGGRIGYAMAFYAADSDSLDLAMIDLLEELVFDISFGLDRLAVARKVRDSELRFASVFRFNPNCILITRLADNRIVDANDAFLDTFDYGYDEVIGRQTTDIHLWSETADRAAVFEYLERTGRVKDFETRLRRRSGDLLDCVVTAEIIALVGERHLVCIVTDVTERIRAERRLHAREQEFRALAENSPDLISRFDRNCRRVYVNPVMGRTFNVDTKKLLGKTPTEAMPESRGAMQVQEALAQVLASATERELEVEEDHVPGIPPVHRHIRFVPEFDAEGRVNSVLVIGRDISRLKESEFRLKETQAQLRELAARQEAARDEERKTMAREIHDVLGQLLTALRLDIGMMAMEFGAGEPLLLARVAKTTELVDGTIAIVRGLATALRPSALDMGIASALQWQINDFERRTEVRCKLSVEIGDAELDDIQAMAVFRLVQESLTNVARHAQAKSVTVTLDKTKGYYALAIVDDGIGFEPAEAPRGSLGLVGMRERVMGLGGELKIDSAPNKGTRIEVRFPVKNTNGATP